MKQSSIIGAVQGLLWLLVCLSPAFGEDYEKKKLFVGRPLTSSLLICQAKELATVGFWRKKDGTVQEGTHIQNELVPPRWRISFVINTATAEVVRINKFNEPESPATNFSVEHSPSGGILLLNPHKRGASPEVISIDPTTSSFIYSSHSVNATVNQTHTWHGSCRNLP